MHTLSSELPKSMSVDSGGTYTPLGRPVVPDEYSMSPPADGPATGVSGMSHTACSRDAQPSMVPSSISRICTFGICASSSPVCAASACEPMKSLAPQSR